MPDLFLLVRSGVRPAEAVTVFEGLHVSQSARLLKRLVRDQSTKRSMRFRVYAGHAAWGAGQLEGELARGDWHVVPADGRWVAGYSGISKSSGE